MPSAWGSLWRTSDIWGKSQSQIEENLKFCFTQGKIEEISKLRTELRKISNSELRKLLYKRTWGNLKYFEEILKFEEISNLSSFIQSRPDDLRFPFFVVFVFWLIFSAIMNVFCYFWDRNILGAKSPPISGRSGDLLRTIFGKLCVFLSITSQRTGLLLRKRGFWHQHSPSTKFYGFYFIDHQPSHAWIIFEI